MIKLDRVWFAIKDLRLAREEIKNNHFLDKVLTIKNSYSLGPFLRIKISNERNSFMNSLLIPPRHTVCTYTVLKNDG